MSIIAEVTAPAEQFGFAETFHHVPTVEFRVVRLVAYRSGCAMPFLWADCEETGRLLAALERDTSVEGIDVLDAFEEECLLEVDWGDPVRAFAESINEMGATVFDVSGRDGGWHFQVFFPDRNPISPTREFCENCDIEVSVRRIDQLSESPVYGQFGLTDRQFETIVSAYEGGYYDIPREMNQAELAEHFDVSHQAVSERLRRAHGTIIRNVLDYRIQQRDHDISPRMRPEVDV